MKHSLLFSIMFLLYGCMAQTGRTEIPLTVVATPTKTLESPKTPSTILTPSLETLFAVAEKCLADRFALNRYTEFTSDVDLATLINGKLALINLKTGTRKIFDQIITDVNSFFASPDGKHISFLSVNGTDRKLWVFTPSIEESPKSFPVSSDVVRLSWISSDKIALWSYSDSYGCQQYEGFFDLDTETIWRPQNGLPELDQTQCRILPTISDDGLTAFYPWQIRDLNTGLTSELHVSDDITTDPPQYVLDLSDDSISILSFKENLLSYVLDLPISNLDRQPIKLHTVQMPAFATKSHYWMLPIVGSNLKQFGWDLIDQNTDVSGYYADPSKGNLPTHFYMVSVASSQFVNYCLDRSVPHNREKMEFAKPVRQGYFSPDGKYFAWTIYSTADYTPPIETQVLDLENGKVIVIENVETFGWVIP